jgi:hypothetical protein
MVLSFRSQRFALRLGMVTILACLCAPAEPPKPKDGPLGMKFVPLPKGTFYMGWDSKDKKATKTEIRKFKGEIRFIRLTRTLFYGVHRSSV